MTRTATHIGTLGSDARARVDASGRVELPAGWTLDWWVGAEDRWHLPTHETAVRQSLVGGAPVVETAMRVPGGDIVQRVYAVPRSDAAGALVVMEVENGSAVPVAVAFARHGAAIADTSVALARRPAQHVEAGELVLDVIPLPHTAMIQAVVALDGHAVEAFPAAVPSATAVAKGWEAQAGRGVRIEVPDSRWSAAFAAARGQLLLAELGDGRLVDEERGRDWIAASAVTRAFDRLGLHPEAERVLLRLGSGDRPTDVTGALLALDHHVRLTDAGDLARGLVEAVAELAHALHRETFRRGRRLRPGAPVTSDVAEAFAAAERLLRRADEVRAADDARADRDVVTTAASASISSASEQPVVPGPRPELSDAARFVEAVLSSLIRFDPGGLALAASVPAGWRGQGWEVHDAPTPAGRLSYAVRWHGERPALLWHLEPHDPTAPPTRLSAPGLDPTWSSTEARGEALLAAAEPRAAGSFS